MRRRIWTWPTERGGPGQEVDLSVDGVRVQDAHVDPIAHAVALAEMARTNDHRCGRAAPGGDGVAAGEAAGRVGEEFQHGTRRAAVVAIGLRQEHRGDQQQHEAGAQRQGDPEAAREQRRVAAVDVTDLRVGERDRDDQGQGQEPRRALRGGCWPGSAADAA
jgi:hypothetical protein